MRRAASLALAAAIVATPVAVTAASSLRSIMHDWRADARITQDMLLGRRAFDQEMVARVLQTYAEDTRRIEGQLNPRTSDARDFKERLVAFRSDLQAALGDLGQRPRLQADISKVFADCQSCHDKFKD